MIERNITAREMLASALHLQLLTGEPTLRMSADVVQMLYDQLTRENEPTVGGWISVNDKLPEKDGLYLCWTMLNNVKLHYLINLWSEGRWYYAHDVRYWMPLPEPPKEDDGK